MNQQQSNVRPAVRWSVGLVFWGLVALVAISLGSALMLLRPTPARDVPATIAPPTNETIRPGGVNLSDITAESGVRFKHTCGGSGQMYIMEAMSAGLATFDYDGDGLLDIYFLNGRPLRGSDASQRPRNALYRNEGNWRFSDVTEQAGVGDAGYGLGVAVADFDNDGDADLYVNNFGPKVLYRNNGDGTFTEVTSEVGIEAGNDVGAGACFLDMDADGSVDLYSANYVQFSYERHPNRVIGGFRRAPSPLDFQTSTSHMYRNNADGTFADVGRESGIGLHAGKGMGTVCTDHDGDGDTDLFVCNDVMANFFFENDGQGRFQEVGTLIGVAYDYWGKANGSMGVDCADIDNDGWFDFFMTDYQAELPCLYRNLRNGMYEDVALNSGTAKACMPHVNWGAAFLDVDCDGDRDLYVAHGHLEPLIHLIDSATAYRLPNTLFLNDGTGHFTDVSLVSGSGMLPVASSRGVCADDLDNDGDQDLVVLNQDDPPTLIRNDTVHDYHWLQVRLVGTRSGRDGIGARVTVVTEDRAQIDEVRSGRGYQSHFGTRLHFGLGARDRVDRLEVRWVGGKTEVYRNIPADRCLTCVEGQGM